MLFRSLIVPCVCYAICLMAATSYAQDGATIDIELSRNQELTGTIVDNAGNPVPSARIELNSLRAHIADATSCEDGTFHLKVPGQGGAFVLSTGEQTMACRVWRNGTAPPSAKKQVMLRSNQIARGQSYVSTGSGCGYFGNSPWVNGVPAGGVGTCETCGVDGDCECYTEGRMGRIGHLKGRMKLHHIGRGHGILHGRVLHHPKILVGALAIGIVGMALDEDDAS